MSLSERLRPDVEAAPWVIEAVKKLEQENADLIKMNKHYNSLSRSRKKRMLQLEKQLAKLSKKLG